MYEAEAVLAKHWQNSLNIQDVLYEEQLEHQPWDKEIFLLYGIQKVH